MAAIDQRAVDAPPGGVASRPRKTRQGQGAATSMPDPATAPADIEAALRQQVRLLDATLENMDQGLLVVNAKGAVQLCNKRALSLLGLPTELALSRPDFGDVLQYLTAQNDFAESTDAVRRWADMTSPEGRSESYERERPNGTVLEVRTAPLSDGGAVRTYTDITDRKRSEIALAESEARLRALADALPQMIWVARASDSVLTYANQRFREYLGDIGPTRKDRIDTHHPDDRDRARALWAAAEAQETVFEIEVRWRSRRGDYRWHKVVLAPVRQAGVIVEWLGTALDIDDIVTAGVVLREKTDLLQLAQEAAGAGLFDWNLTDGSCRLSVESLRLFGLPSNGGDQVPAQTVIDMIHPDDLPGVVQEAARAAATETTYRTEFRVRRREGPDGWVLGIGRVVRDASGQAARIVGLNLDISERRGAEETLRASEERFALALDSGSDGLWDWNVGTGAVWYSDRWQSMLGYTPGELEASIKTWERLIHPDDREMAVALTTAHFEGQTPAYENEHRLRRKDGGWSWVLSRGKVMVRDAEGRPLRAVGTHIDIDARKAAESQIAYMACHDILTDLPNRTLFRDRLDQRLAEIARHGGSCAVLSLDLDGFKAVNDSLGHFAGDAVLRDIAQRLKAALRADDTVARLGGDEFAVLVADAGARDRLKTLTDLLIAITRTPVNFGVHQVDVGLSIGVALAPEQGLDGESLLKRADLALYRAKADGRNATCFFTSAMDEEAMAKRLLERDLRTAITQNELMLHYQPQFLGATGELVGFEALVRWQHPERGLVMPSSFIGLAEETGLIVALGEWVLRSACHEAARWGGPLKVAVNLSPRQFQQADLPDMVLAILTETGLSPKRLELEVTESVIINDMTRALAILRRLKALGVGIAMDDFGTGYSSLATLQAFPFDKIKIDRMFVGQITESPQAEAIVRAILGLGRSLNMGVVAEGVETVEQRRFLSQESCEELQGYLLGKPQPIGQFAEAIARSGTGPEPEGSEAGPPRAETRRLGQARLSDGRR